jgi:hypothetical protein
LGEHDELRQNGKLGTHRQQHQKLIHVYLFVWIEPSGRKYNTGSLNLRLRLNHTPFVILQNGGSLVKVSNSSLNGWTKLNSRA